MGIDILSLAFTNKDDIVPDAGMIAEIFRVGGRHGGSCCSC